MSKLMTMISKIFTRVNMAAASLILMSSSAFADTTPDATMEIRDVFRKQLLASIGDAFLNNGLLDWSKSGLLTYLFTLCTVIAIFQVVYRHYGSSTFLVEWVKIPFYALISLAILGGWPGYTAIFNYQSKGYSGVRTLDKDVYYYAADKFDQLAAELDKGSGPDLYEEESHKFFVSMTKIQEAVLDCKVFGDSTCVTSKLQNLQQEQNAPADTAEKSDPGVMDTVKLMAKKVIDLIEMATAPFPFWALQLINWVLELIRMFVNYFTLVAFALIAAMGLFFCKIFTIFLVLPDFRTRVWNAYKLPLSASMYGFVTSLIISCSTVIIRGINDATLTALVTKAGAGGLTTIDLMKVLFGSALAASAVLAIQILSMSKVPGLCRKLWDLSLEELVEFGKTVVEAGLGVMKAAGGAALFAGAMVATGGAAAAAARGAGAGIGGSLKAGFSGAGRAGRAMAGGGMPGGGLQGLLGLKGVGGSSEGGGGPSGGGGSSLGGVTGSPKIGGGGGGTGSGGAGAVASDSAGLAGVTGSGPTSGGGGAGRIGLKGNKAEAEEGSESSSAEESKSAKAPKDKEADKFSDGTDKPQTLKEARNAKRWAMANHAFQGALHIGKGLGNLAGAGMGAAFGRDIDALGIAGGHAQAATMGIGKVAEAHQEHSAHREQLVSNVMSSFKGEHEKAMNGFDINHDEAASVIEGIRTGKNTEDSYKNLSRLIHNGDMGKLHFENKELFNSVMAESKRDAFKDWESQRKEKVAAAALASTTKGLRGNSTGLHHENLEELVSLMKQGYINKDDDVKLDDVKRHHEGFTNNSKATFGNENFSDEFSRRKESKDSGKNSNNEGTTTEQDDYFKNSTKHQAETHTMTMESKKKPQPSPPTPSPAAPTQPAAPAQPQVETIVVQANTSMGIKKPSFTIQNDDFISKMKELAQTDTYKKMTPDEQILAKNKLLEDLSKKK